MRLLVLFLFTFSASCMAGAKDYIYPSFKDINIDKCNIDTKTIAEVEVNYSSIDLGDSGLATAEAVDLNRDGVCEILLSPPSAYIGNGNAFTTILIVKNNSYQPSGDIQWGKRSWWYGEAKNGYPRIFVKTYIGHRTNPIYVTDVYSYNGSNYIKEFDSQYSHGQFMDLGLKAYKSKKYNAAEKWYLNAYRMNQESSLGDANNLALVYIRLNRCDEAVNLLERHLKLPDNSEKHIKSAKYNLDLCLKANSANR
ncbi:tetratricopeptide repeat protein [Microbulbifer sp. TRSA002]|uniref:tetratricopeptide repeat protein n=1 Tax=Microbulbifer sp. TRSA002 TaxID=3243382 RepID=UPI0040390D90